MEYRILGPLEVFHGGSPVAVGRGKRRSLLALLLLHANEVVSAERLIDGLWGEHPPATSAKSLQVHVSQLRRELHAGAPELNGEELATRAGGYVLHVGPDDLDVERFERLLAEGARALASGQAQRAAARLREGLDLWRGSRSPTSRTSRLRSTRSLGSRSCGWRRSNSGSRPTSRSVAMPRSSGSSMCSCASIRCASDCAGC